MLRFSLGVTRMDRIRNEYIRGTVHVGCFGDKVREARIYDGLVMYCRGIVNILVEKCWGWNCQEGGLEDKRGDLWML